MENKKHHYRSVFKSEHLGSADLEEFIEDGKSLIFTIKEVKQEYDVSVAGKKGNFNIAYFKENIKPLVLNAGNSAIVSGFSNGSKFVEDWKNITIELYIDPNVKFGKEVVGGVRIKKTIPANDLAEIEKQFALKKEQITDPEQMEAIERIIANREQNNYKKTLTFLNKLA